MNKINNRESLIDKMEVLVQEKETTVESFKTTYLTAGSGYPVIFLHGAGAGAVTWYPTIATVSEKFKVIVPDIIGYGESDKPNEPYDRPFFSKWLKSFLEELKISKAHIIGLSQGGAIALQFTIDNPDIVDKLILVDSAGLGAKISFWALLGTIWMNNFPSFQSNRFNSKFILHKPTNRDPNHSLYSIAVLKEKGGKNAFRQGRGAAVTKIAIELLKQIKNETLIIWGENDKLFPIEYGQMATKFISNSKFHPIQHAGHLPHMDHPEIFNKTLMDFLKMD